MQDKGILKLYVTGKSPRTDQAIQNLKSICDDKFPGQFQIVIIDVLEHPKLAEDEKIMATPTLVRDFPPPIRRIIGDLSDKDQVLLGLDFVPDMYSVEQAH
ncbi:MAG: circadian clock KaiB family protein [Cyanobacteria bacterium P01_H01_bin.74]